MLARMALSLAMVARKERFRRWQGGTEIPMHLKSLVVD
jgi:hypothetical protein